MKNKIYAGIGSRETPDAILEVMTSIGYNLAQKGWGLRSGHAPGADQAFEAGCIRAEGLMEIYLPWKGFEKAPTMHPAYTVPKFDSFMMELAAKHHPAWDRCKEGARKLHARNVCQIFGRNPQSPLMTQMVIAWTPGAKGGGGTGQAIRMAKSYGIPCFDLADTAQWDSLAQFVENFNK
ncbi:hypothetical protein [Xanthomonas virus PB119]|nr:hypothetical protein [Xanthomonas virus PB119]